MTKPVLTEETLMRSLCVGKAPLKKSENGYEAPVKSLFLGCHKPYVYGASKVSLRPFPPKDEVLDN